MRIFREQYIGAVNLSSLVQQYLSWGEISLFRGRLSAHVSMARDEELINQYLKRNDLYVLYIHPFELSRLPLPAVPTLLEL